MSDNHCGVAHLITDADAHKEQQNGKAPCVDDPSKMSTEELSEFGELRLVGKFFVDVDSLVATVNGNSTNIVPVLLSD